VFFESDGVVDWDTFHAVSQETFGFPDSYGRNMDAWIDCLTYVREGDGMSRFELEKDEMLEIEVSNTKAFSRRVPEVFDALVECSAFVNSRNTGPVISLIFTEPPDTV